VSHPHLLQTVTALRSLAQIILLAGAFLCGGCHPPNPEDVLGNSGETSESRSAQNCRDNLRNALSSLAPDRLEISADVESTIDVLNRWLTDCATLDKISPEELQQIERVSSPSARDNLLHERFTQRDANFVRNAILCHQIVDQETILSKNDRERTVKLFEFVVRNVVLTPDTQALPLTLYEILLFGRGSEEQQAWVFAELLRQLRIDSAILETKAEDAGKPDWIFAVFLDEGTYLFDFHLQIPVPNDPVTEELEIRTPATLAQVFERPELLSSLRELGSHVPTAEALKTAEIQILAESAHWSPRMKALNSQLAGENFLLFDGLLDHEGGQGALNRVTAFAKHYWEQPRISVSNLPDRQSREFWQIEENSSKAQALAVRRDPFRAPLDMKIDSLTGQPRQIPSQQQWTSRLAQLQGKFSEAVRSYGLIRLDEKKKSSAMTAEDLKNPFLQVYLRTHQLASQDAHFWVAISQLELDEFEEASDTFADYQKQFPKGRWSDALPYLWGKNSLRLGNTTKARELLESIDETSQFHGPARYQLKVMEKRNIGKPEERKSDTGQPKTEKPDES
jgi:hypothetical protein